MLRSRALRREGMVRPPAPQGRGAETIWVVYSLALVFFA